MTSAAAGVSLVPRITLDGGPLPTSLSGTLVALRVVRPLRTTAWARLELAVDDSAHVLDPARGIGAVKVGQKVTVGGRPSDKPVVATVFEGTVTRIESVRGERGGTRLVVTAQDASALLASETAQTFVEEGLASILGKIVRPAGLRVDATGLPAPKVHYMLQAGSALRFVDDVAQRTGSDWTLDGTTLRLWPAGAPRPGADHVVLRADEVATSEVSQESGGPTRAVVTSWDPEAGAAVTGEHERTAADGIAVAERVVLDSTSFPLDADEASRIARARLAGSGPVAARALVRRLVPLAPGSRLTLQHTWWPSDAEYVREVTTTWDRAGWSTEIITGSRARTTLADLGGRAADRGAAAYTHDGVVVGIVTALGAQNDARGAGRVKVEFPFLGRTITSDWARVASAGGGEGRGLLVVPEVGDEVLVAFEGSDVRRPVVVSGLHSGRRKAPGTYPVEGSTVSRRGFTSRKGNLLELVDGDSAAKDHVLLALPGGESRLRLGGDAADLTVPKGTPVRIQAGATRIVLGDDGSVTVEGATITVRAQQKLALEAAEISVRAKGKLALEGADVSVKGQAKAALEAGGVTQVKGGMVQIN